MTTWRLTGMVSLDKKMQANAAFCLIGRHCLAQLHINQTFTLQSDDPEGVHQMRIALRRLRAAMGAFRPVLDAEEYARLANEVHWAAATLGAARDLDVFLNETFPLLFEQLNHDPCLLGLQDRARIAKKETYVKARAMLKSRRFQRMLQSFEAWFESMPSDEHQEKVKKVAEERLRKRYKQLLRYGQSLGQATIPERHRARIACKKLRYSVEFFNSLYQANDAHKFLKCLVKLQDALGVLNDMAVTAGLVSKLAGRHPNKGMGDALHIFSGWNSCRYMRQLTEAEKVMHAFSKLKPFW